jgi:hypothetical protein
MLTVVSETSKFVKSRCYPISISFGHRLDVAEMRLEDVDLLVVATAYESYTAISDYAKR